MRPRFGLFGSTRFVSTWILALLAVSIVSVVTGGFVAHFAALAPARIWHGEVWRLVTWTAVEASPLQLVWTCVTIYKFGNELVLRWGERRVRRVVLEILISAAVVTTLLALVSEGAWHLRRLGGWALGDVLVIAWARTFPERTLVLYQFLELRGRDVIRLTIGVNVLYAIFVGPLHLAPELLACAGAALYPASRWRRSPR